MSDKAKTTGNPKLPTELKAVSAQAVTENDLGITEGLMAQAQKLVDSKLLPDHIDSPSKAVVIMQMGKELGFAPMASFTNIYVVSGTPALSGKAMLALLRKGGVVVKTIEDCAVIKDGEGKVVNKRTTLAFLRDGHEEKCSFSWSEANAAGLVKRDVWKKYLKVMMWWRCLAIGARRVAPDLLMGMYEISEMADVHGAPISVDSEGDVVVDAIVVEEKATEAETKAEAPVEAEAEIE